MRESGIESAERAWHAARWVAGATVALSAVAIVVLALRHGTLIGIAGVVALPYVVLAVMFVVEHAPRRERRPVEERAVSGSVAAGH